LNPPKSKKEPRTTAKAETLGLFVCKHYAKRKKGRKKERYAILENEGIRLI
jgi:hypothetical protein